MTAELLKNSAIVLNLSRTADDYLYSSDRMAHAMGNGCLIFQDLRTGFQNIFKEDEIAFYSDNDFLIDNIRTNPQFKPGFGIDTILSRNYIGDLLVVNSVFLKAYPKLLDNLEEEIIYDLVLRISDYTHEIVHIPRILYHYKESRVQNYKAQEQIIKNYLERNSIEYNSIKHGLYEGDFKIEYKISGTPKISIVVPNKDHVEDLKKLINSIKNSTYDNYEFIVVENNSEEKETFDYYDEIQKADPRILQRPGSAGVVVLYGGGQTERRFPWKCLAGYGGASSREQPAE